LKSLLSHKTNSINGTITIPGDKSISQRALILSSVAIGTSEIYGLSFSEDILDLIKNLKLLGVNIIVKKEKVIIKGNGINGLKKTNNILHMGNSGTATRLMMGILSNQDFATKITGDKSLNKRPMDRIIDPLIKMGAEIKSNNNKLPITLRGVSETLPIKYVLPIPSAQVKSCILFASLGTPGITTVIENILTRNHTEILLKLFGAKINIKKEKKRNLIELQGQKDLIGTNINICGDTSSAAIVGAAALLNQNSQLKIKNVNINKTRNTFFKVLKQMNANICFSNKKKKSNEDVADITFKSSKLKGIHLKKETVTGMIDEIPIFSVLASFASGNSSFSGGKELRYKESDRINSIYKGLLACKAQVKKKGDGLIIKGKKNDIYGNSKIKTYFDHRIAMSFLIMGTAAKKTIKIDDGNCIKTSFPNFVNLMNNIGAKIK